MARKGSDVAPDVDLHSFPMKVKNVEKVEHTWHLF